MSTVGRNNDIDIGLAVLAFGSPATSIFVESTTGSLTFGFHFIGIVLLDHLAEKLLVFGLITVFDLAAAFVAHEYRGAFAALVHLANMGVRMSHLTSPSDGALFIKASMRIIVANLIGHCRIGTFWRSTNMTLRHIGINRFTACILRTLRSFATCLIHSAGRHNTCATKTAIAGLGLGTTVLVSVLYCHEALSLYDTLKIIGYFGLTGFLTFANARADSSLAWCISLACSISCSCFCRSRSIPAV
jgi:hypothetical protein